MSCHVPSYLSNITATIYGKSLVPPRTRLAVNTGLLVSHPNHAASLDQTEFTMKTYSIAFCPQNARDLHGSTHRCQYCWDKSIAHSQKVGTTRSIGTPQWYLDLTSFGIMLWIQRLGLERPCQSIRQFKNIFISKLDAHKPWIHVWFKRSTVLLMC